MDDGPNWHWQLPLEKPRETFVPPLAGEIEAAFFRGFGGDERVGIDEVRFERIAGEPGHAGEVVIVVGSLYPLRGGYFYMRMRRPLVEILAFRDVGKLDGEVAEIRDAFVEELERHEREQG